MRQLSLLEHHRLRFPERGDPEHIEKIAAETIAELDLEPPIPMEVVASYRDIGDIRVVPLPMAGSLTPEDGGFVIRLRAEDSYVRRRFTGFHEIGHSFQPGYAEAPSFRCAAPSPQLTRGTDPEALSDLAAAEMLLPAAFVAAEFNDQPFGLDAVVDLAARYQASIQATAYRYVRFRVEDALLLTLEPGLRKNAPLDEEPVLRVRTVSASGDWPFVPRNKSALPTGCLHRAGMGELIYESTDLESELGLGGDRAVEISARRFDYHVHGSIRPRVLAILRPRRSRVVRG